MFLERSYSVKELFYTCPWDWFPEDFSEKEREFLGSDLLFDKVVILWVVKVEYGDPSTIRPKFYLFSFFFVFSIQVTMQHLQSHRSELLDKELNTGKIDGDTGVGFRQVGIMDNYFFLFWFLFFKEAVFFTLVLFWFLFWVVRHYYNFKNNEKLIWEQFQLLKRAFKSFCKNAIQKTFT